MIHASPGSGVAIGENNGISPRLGAPAGNDGGGSLRLGHPGFRAKHTTGDTFEAAGFEPDRAWGTAS